MNNYEQQHCLLFYPDQFEKLGDIRNIISFCLVYNLFLSEIRPLRYNSVKSNKQPSVVLGICTAELWTTFIKQTR